MPEAKRIRPTTSEPSAAAWLVLFSDAIRLQRVKGSFSTAKEAYEYATLLTIKYFYHNELGSQDLDDTRDQMLELDILEGGHRAYFTVLKVPKPSPRGEVVSKLRAKLESAGSADTRALYEIANKVIADRVAKGRVPKGRVAHPQPK